MTSTVRHCRRNERITPRHFCVEAGSGYGAERRRRCGAGRCSKRGGGGASIDAAIPPGVDAA